MLASRWQNPVGHSSNAAAEEERGFLMRLKLILWVLLTQVMTTAIGTTPALRAQTQPRRIEVTAKRFAYEPSEITVKKGEPVILVIKSQDVAHGLRFRELNLNAKVDKGGSAELQFTPDKTGDFVGHCSVFCGSGHGEMTLTMHVVN
jgi:cytochrome c oxidase subunit II